MTPLESLIALIGDGDDDVVGPVAGALARSGDTTLIPHLLTALDACLDDENAYGRDTIAEVLCGVAGRSALPALLRAAAFDIGDDQDGLQSLIGELRHEDPAGFRDVVVMMATAADPDDFRAGRLALGMAFVGDDLSDSDLNLLLLAVGDPDEEVRRVAVGTLPRPSGRDRVLRVLAAALRDPDHQVRRLAIDRLGVGGGHHAVEVLAEAAPGMDLGDRAAVAHALGRTGDEAAIPALLGLLGDDERRVRDRAREALAGIGGSVAVDVLLAQAGSADPVVRAQTAKTVVRVLGRDPRVRGAVEALGRDADPAVRAATLSGLATVASGDGLPLWTALVLELAADPDASVRARVAAVARHLVPDGWQSLLERLAADSSGFVREAAEIQARVGRTTGWS